jgi:hypothetical protein
VGGCYNIIVNVFLEFASLHRHLRAYDYDNNSSNARVLSVCLTPLDSNGASLHFTDRSRSKEPFKSRVEHCRVRTILLGRNSQVTKSPITLVSFFAQWDFSNWVLVTTNWPLEKARWNKDKEFPTFQVRDIHTSCWVELNWYFMEFYPMTYIRTWMETMNHFLHQTFRWRQQQ